MGNVIQSEIVLSCPAGNIGKEARDLLDVAGIDYTIIYKDDGDPSLSEENSIYPWKGLKGIRSFIATRK